MTWYFCCNLLVFAAISLHDLTYIPFSIVRWKNATGMRDFTTIDEHVIKTLHGKNTGRWGLTCKVYRDNSRNNTGKLLYQISLAQQPRQLYCMVDGGVVVEVERDVEAIFSRLKNLWVVRQSATIEVTAGDEQPEYHFMMNETILTALRINFKGY